MSITSAEMSLQAILGRFPIPFIYAGTSFLATEVSTYLPLLPTTVDGLSTVAIATGGAFILGGLKWIDSELVMLYPTLAGQPQSSAGQQSNTGSGSSPSSSTTSTSNANASAPVSATGTNGASIVVSYDSDDGLSVSGASFAPNAQYTVVIGQNNGGYQNVAGGQTSASGAFVADVNEDAVSNSVAGTANLGSNTTNVLTYDSAGNKVQVSIAI